MGDGVSIEIGKQVRDLYKSTDSAVVKKRFPVRESDLWCVIRHFPKNIDGLSLGEQLNDLPSGSKILDIGAGSGATALQIERDYPKTQVYTLNPYICEKLRDYQTIVGGLQTLRVNKEAMKELQEKGPFDVTYANWVYRHLPDPLAVLKTQWMLTKNGGDLYGDDISLFEPFDFQKRWVDKLLKFWEIMGIEGFKLMNRATKEGICVQTSLYFAVRKTAKKLPIPVKIIGLRGEKDNKCVEYCFDHELAEQILEKRGLLEQWNKEKV